MRTTAMIVTALLGTGVLAAPPATADPGRVTQVRSIESPAADPHPTAPRAGTSVVLGQTTFTTLHSCNGVAPFGIVTSTSGGGASYTAPSAGVITSWSTVGGNAGGSSRALLFVPGTLANHKTLVGKSDWMPVPITFGVVHTFPTRIPVLAGWQLGLGTAVSGQACAIGAGLAGDVLGTQAGFNADTSTDLTMVNAATLRPDVSAVLEPDVDGDGYGDLSQDLCPESKLAQAACPAPDTTVTKKPKRSSTRRAAKIKFVSNIPGSTFTCAVDGKRTKPCASPFKKKFRYGKHRVVVTAISPAGIADATPATVTFKVKKPR